ncbi:MAG: pectate lyase [Pirellulales bacterium]
MLIRVVAVTMLTLSFTPVRADLRQEAEAGLKKAIAFFHRQVAVEGGYVYSYSGELKLREGEGKAGPRTVWVQPPGTPAVGDAMLEAYERTGEQAYLDAALDAGRALVRGQMHSGGWTNRIEFDPALRKGFAYRVDGPPGKRARNISSFDDDQTQSALRLLMRLDRATNETDKPIHEAAMYGLDAVIRNQHRNGAWSQVFDGAHVRDDEPKPASYPTDWPRQHPGGDYWWHYTFNDGAMAAVIETLLEAERLYGNPKYKEAAIRGGEFILRAQMPPPQPSWAQQYNADMHPAWARKFEPPAVSSSETAGVIRILIALNQATGAERFLAPVPAALDWLKKSALPGGGHARFYELQTNKPLYLTRDYQLTYEPNDLPTHYSFIQKDVGLSRLERQYRNAMSHNNESRLPTESSRPVSDNEVRRILDALDERGAWVEQGALKSYGHVGPIIDSRTFIRNVDRLSRYLAVLRAAPAR